MSQISKQAMHVAITRRRVRPSVLAAGHNPEFSIRADPSKMHAV